MTTTSHGSGIDITIEDSLVCYFLSCNPDLKALSAWMYLSKFQGKVYLSGHYIVDEYTSLFEAAKCLIISPSDAPSSKKQLPFKIQMYPCDDGHPCGFGHPKKTAEGCYGPCGSGQCQFLDIQLHIEWHNQQASLQLLKSSDSLNDKTISSSSSSSSTMTASSFPSLVDICHSKPIRQFVYLNPSVHAHYCDLKQKFSTMTLHDYASMGESESYHPDLTLVSDTFLPENDMLIKIHDTGEYRHVLHVDLKIFVARKEYYLRLLMAGLPTI